MAKIFISHSSEDKKIVDLFKNIILNAGLGISDNDIAYTSAPETGVPTGGNIPQYIKENIADSDFVFFMISDNYRKSEVCLNEMGAAWALEKNVKPLLLRDVSFESVGWLYGMNLCAKIDDEDRLDELHDEFLDKFDLLPKTAVWNRHRNEFLSRIKNKINISSHIISKGLAEYNIELEESEMSYNRSVEVLNSICDLYIAQKINPLLEEFVKFRTNVLYQKNYLEKISPVLEEFSRDIEKCVDTLNDKCICLVNCAISIYAYPTISTEDKLTCESKIISYLNYFEQLKRAIISCRQSLYDLPDLGIRQINAKNKIVTSFTKVTTTLNDCINKLNSAIY